VSVRRWLPDPFLMAIAAAVACAAAYPRLGTHDGPLHLYAVNTLAVSVVFFLHGAALSLEALKRGLRDLRLHWVAQSTTFLVFPALGALISWAAPALPPAIGLGFFFLSTVSSTISSAVAMTAVAGGDVAGALFNATLSGILGVFVTPTYVSLMASTAGLNLSLPAVIASVALKILLPLSLGQFVRPFIQGFLMRHRSVIHTADRGSIVLIVYGAFCDSIAGGVWNRGAWLPAVCSVVVAVGMLVVVSGFLWAQIRLTRLSRPSAIAAYFCGSQKSLANGLPTAQAIFGSSPSLGLIVMPLLVYHQVQLAIGAIIARRLAQGERS
jgi:solute carrier family 10 (sodium/bile acid cotransporter), member 7